MISTPDSIYSFARSYLNRLNDCFTDELVTSIELLANDLCDAWINRRNVFICGNGGSAANAMHIANDFHYGIGSCGNGPRLPGLMVEALPANPAVLTCLANDTGYGNIFSNQLQVKARAGDLLIVLSGSGNSDNVVNALKVSNSLGLKSYAILAFSGGRCLDLASVPIHFPVSDMQLAEDAQMVVGHLCMQWLTYNKPTELSPLF